MRQSCGEKEAFWRFVLCEHAESGLSISEFCRREGVSQASFYQWRKKLAGSAATTTATSAASRTGNTGELAANTSFIPVEVVPPICRNSAGQQPSTQSRNAAASLTIRTPQGYAVDVSASTSIDVLQCSLRALQQLASESSS